MKYSVEHYEQTDACRNTAARLIELASMSYLEALKPDAPLPMKAIEAGMNAWKAGSYKLIFARDDANEVQGYQLWTFGAGNWSNEPMAELSSVYITLANRGKSFSEFIDYGVMAVKIMGAKKIDITVDANTRMHHYFKRKGWTDRVVVMRMPA